MVLPFKEQPDSIKTEAFQDPATILESQFIEICKAENLQVFTEDAIQRFRMNAFIQAKKTDKKGQDRIIKAVTDEFSTLS